MAESARCPTRIIATACSAAGLSALMRVLSELPADFPAAILVVQHRAAARGTILERILQRATPLRVLPMEDGQEIGPGHVYVAPPDRHVRVTPQHTIALSNGRRIRHVRSSAHPLYDSLATIYGPAAIGLVLSGSGSDASAGAQVLRAAGGIVVAQDHTRPELVNTARGALTSGPVTSVVALGEVSHVLRRLVGEDLAVAPAVASSPSHPAL